MEVFLEVTVQHKKYHAGFMERMRQQPEVTSCYQVEGEYDFLVKADVTSEKELEEAIDAISPYFTNPHSFIISLS